MKSLWAVISDYRNDSGVGVVRSRSIRPRPRERVTEPVLNQNEREVSFTGRPIVCVRAAVQF